MDEQSFLFEKFFQDRKTLEQMGQELGTDNPEFIKNKLMETEFSELVDVMRNPEHLPLPSINALMTLFWRLVGNKISPVAMTDAVPTLSFWAEIRGGRTLAFILCPIKWYEMLREDPHYQMGALVFAASQSKDYWNHQMLPHTRKAVKDRAWSSEAELLLYFARTSPKFKPNEYQQKIMQEYPLGIKSCSDHYIGRDYDGEFPPYPVDPSRLSQG